MNNNTEQEKDIKKEITKLNTILEKIAIYIEKINMREYVEIIQSPARLIYVNFLGGVSRGFGIAFGMTLIFGIFLFVLSKLVDIPLIGKYIAAIVEIVNQELRNK